MLLSLQSSSFKFIKREMLVGLFVPAIGLNICRRWFCSFCLPCREFCIRKAEVTPTIILSRDKANASHDDTRIRPAIRLCIMVGFRDIIIVIASNQSVKPAGNAINCYSSKIADEVPRLSTTRTTNRLDATSSTIHVHFSSSRRNWVWLTRLNYR